MKKNTPKIHKDMLVGDVVAMLPDAADIISSYGLHCVGCHANAYETLEQGLLGHGYPEEVLQKMIDELNDYIDLKEKDPVPSEQAIRNFKISLTPAAKKQVLAIAKKDDKAGKALRLEVKVLPGAYKYGINFIEDEEIGSDDQVFFFNRKKIRLVAKKRDANKINGLEIDYVDEKDRSGFKMNNPNTAL